VPYLGQVIIVGPEPEPGRRQHFIDALGAAMAQGWDSPFARALSADDTGDSEPDRDRPARVVLEHRIFGYPGGATITAVLDGDSLEFEEAAATLASLGRHLTTWSPELLEYTLQQVDVSRLEQRWDEDNWLPPLDRFAADDEPVRPLSALLGDPLQQLAAQYLVAGAVRSVWEPGKRVNHPVFTARDLALGAADHFWQDEITTVLGAMLIQAARLEKNDDRDHAHLCVAEGASRTVTDDLVRRARLTANDSETDGFTDDQMRGHLLLEGFIKANHLDWMASDERPDHREARRVDLMRQILGAGFGALATLRLTVRGVVRSAWELAAELTEDPVVTVIADLESARIDEDIDHDAAEVWAIATSHAAVWTAIHRPDLLDTGVGRELLDDLTDNLGTLHHVVYSTLAILGPGTNAAVLDDPRLSPTVKPPMRDFVAAQRSFQDDGYSGDVLDTMHRAVGTVLELGREDPGCLREVLRFITIAVSLAATEADANPGQQGSVVTPEDLSAALLWHADRHSTIVFSQESHGDDAIRTARLAVLALLAPEAAAAMAAQLPLLDDEDPRSGPAAREQAMRWIHKAAEFAADQAEETPSDPEGSDARLLLALYRDGQPAPEDWAARRLVAAAAEAAAFLIHPTSLEDAAGVIAVFDRS